VRRGVVCDCVCGRLWPGCAVPVARYSYGCARQSWRASAAPVRRNSYATHVPATMAALGPGKPATARGQQCSVGKHWKGYLAGDHESSRKPRQVQWAMTGEVTRQHSQPQTATARKNHENSTVRSHYRRLVYKTTWVGSLPFQCMYASFIHTLCDGMKIRVLDKILLIPEFCSGGQRQRLTVNDSTLLVENDRKKASKPTESPHSVPGPRIQQISLLVAA